MKMISEGGTGGQVTLRSEQNESPHFRLEGVNVWVKKKNGKGEMHVLRDVSLDVERQKVLAIIGPSGCGKSTLLRSLNRMNLHVYWRFGGAILFNGRDIHDSTVDEVELRKQVGMVFQKPNPFPKSIYENVAYGPRIHGLADSRKEFDAIVADNLQRAGLFEEVKDRLDDPATTLSGGQQQRLCIARALAVAPEVLLMDEPCASLDPIATARIEELIGELRENYTIVIVTHNMHQAGRVADRIAFLCKVDPENPEKIASNESVPGTLVEVGDVDSVLQHPQHPLTEAFVTGRFG